MKCAEKMKRFLCWLMCHLPRATVVVERQNLKMVVVRCDRCDKELLKVSVIQN
jgi:hypothetical protein